MLSLPNPPEKWLRFESTHELLIDRETWNIVQRVRQRKHRSNKMGEQELPVLPNKPEHEISAGKGTILNADWFTAVVGRYTEIQKRTSEIVREFVKKIVVHERSEPHKKKHYPSRLMSILTL